MAGPSAGREVSPQLDDEVGCCGSEGGCAPRFLPPRAVEPWKTLAIGLINKRHQSLTVNEMRGWMGMATAMAGVGRFAAVMWVAPVAPHLGTASERFAARGKLELLRAGWSERIRFHIGQS